MLVVIVKKGREMASDTRIRMVEGAVRLLAERGLQETSFSEVLELTGAPRGSIYHHFPEGKDQLVAAAVDLAGDRAIRLIDGMSGASAVEVTTRFLGMWRLVLEKSSFQAGCSVLAVTVATDSGALLEHASSVFRRWRSKLAELLETGGMLAADAPRFATTLIATAEGAVVMGRAEQSLEPFDQASDQLISLAQSLSRR
jgi:TetR/AcrR family transcriptional repressor of lmrAB and yxaGH operons